MDDAAPLMHADWIRWFTAVQQAIETPIAGVSPEQLTMSSGRLLGRTTAGIGAAEQISVAGSLTLSGGVLTGTGTVVTPSALTRVDDTNITLTLGGTPATALLQAVSLTLGWAGTLAVARGGIGVGTLASNGVIYGNGTGSVQALAVNASATQKFLSQVSSGAPTWAEVAFTVRGEVPAGLVNGSNTVYTTAAAYGDDLAVYRNGIRQKLTTDYTETTATTFTFVTAPLTGDLLQVDYSESGGSGGGSGGYVLLEQHTAASSSELVFTTGITSTYDDYEFRFVGLLPATFQANLLVRFSTDGGASYDSSAIYDCSFSYSSTSGSNNAGTGTPNGTSFDIGGDQDNASTTNLIGNLNLIAPLDTTQHKGAYGKFHYGHASVGRISIERSCVYRNASAVNAVRFFYHTGNIAVGTIRLYGRVLA